MRFFNSIWRLILAALTLLGVFYLPVDIQQSDQALKPWQKLIAMIDQLTALKIFGVLAVFWIAWIDLRPFFYRWRDRRWPKLVSPIKVSPHIYVETLGLNGRAKLKTVWANEFYLVIENDAQDSSILSRVQCRFFFIGEPSLSTAKETSDSSVDVRHGELAMFKIGRLVTTEPLGHVHFSNEKIGRDKQKAYEHNVPKGYLSFEMSSHPNKNPFGLSFNPDHRNTWEVWAILSANNVLSRKIVVTIDMANIAKPVSWHEADTKVSDH